MKKILLFIMAVVLVLSAVQVPAIAVEKYPEDVCDDVYFDNSAICVKKPGFTGTTPPKTTASLMSELIPEEMVNISTQIYDNFTKQSPDFYLYTDAGLKNLSQWHEMTDEQFEYVVQKANTIMRGCKTADEKIYAVVKYIAQNVGYDYDYYEKHDKEYDDLNINAYEVLKNETTVCLGYSDASAVLLQIAGIPCDIIHSPNHAWNIAWNGEKWVLFDTTWITNSEYRDGILYKSNDLNMKWFDFTIDHANSNYNHLIQNVSYAEYNNAIYSFPIYTKAKNFTIPSHITKIDKYSFYKCNDVAISCDAVLEEVGTAAFYQCSKLSDVNLSNVVNVESHAFLGCTSLESIGSLECAETIAEYAFYQCNNINGEINTKNVKTVGKSAFYECYNLDGVINLKNAVSIDKYAFYSCRDIDGIIVGKGITVLPYAVFYDCSSVSAVILPKTLTYIDEFAISNCANLSDIYYEGTTEDIKSLVVEQYNDSYKTKNITYSFVPNITLRKYSTYVKVTYEGVPTSEVCYCAEYKGDKMIRARSMPLEGNMRFDNIKSNATTVKIIVVDDIEFMRPHLKAKSVKY